jgi:hypothetical protein
MLQIVTDLSPLLDGGGFWDEWRYVLLKFYSANNICLKLPFNLECNLVVLKPGKDPVRAMKACGRVEV